MEDGPFLACTVYIEARYFKFKQLNAGIFLVSTIDLTKLPPTSNAAYQHTFRVYHQIQTWLDN